jgi:hypothetical protein
VVRTALTDIRDNNFMLDADAPVHLEPLALEGGSEQGSRAAVRRSRATGRFRLPR